MNSILSALFAPHLLLLLQAGAPCVPDWIPTFGGEPGVASDVRAMAVHDDGTGPALFVAGNLTAAGGVPVNGIAKWDGSSWSALGTGVLTHIHALAVFDDGSGPALYAGGLFSEAGGVLASNIARWDGTAWSALAQGTNGFVLALAVHDDGSGPALFVGGDFTVAGTVAARNVARWDGSSWSPLGSGVQSGSVMAMTSFDDGTGPSLFVGGEFTQAGGLPASAIAKWDGSAWSELGGGVDGRVSALAVHDDGSGSALFVGGGFRNVGSLQATCVAKWDGTSWSGLAGGLPGVVSSLHVHDDGLGGGPALYAGGSQLQPGGTPYARVHRWDGSSWTTLQGIGRAVGVDGVSALAVFEHPSSGLPALFAGGFFETVDGLAAGGVACWDGQRWAPLPGGLGGAVQSLAVQDDGSGPALYAGGTFLSAAGSSATGIARWRGSSWEPLGVDLSAPLGASVSALAVFDDSTGPALYLGGTFLTDGGVTLNHVAKWDGASLSPLGSGMNGTVQDLAVFDAGHGPELYACGYFTVAGGVAAAYVAKWNGTTWSALGSGLQFRGETLAVLDDGQGPALYVGGNFHFAGGIAARNVARWDGQAWSSLDDGVSHPVNALIAFDDGTGPALYAGGEFYSASGTPVNFIAKWDGTAWSPLGGGFYDHVDALAVYDDGSGGGPRLYASGRAPSTSGVPRYSVSRWDGSAWTAVGEFDGRVRALATCTDGSGAGPTLCAGGEFRLSPGGDSFLARWGGCAPIAPGVAYCAGDGSAAPCPCANTGAAGAGCGNSTGAGAVLGAQGSGSVLANDLVLRGSELPAGQVALLYMGPHAIGGGLGAPLGDGLRCVGGGVRRLGLQLADPAGDATWGPGLTQGLGIVPGSTRHFQVWYRDPAGPCNQGSNLSNGYAVTILH